MRSDSRTGVEDARATNTEKPNINKIHTGLFFFLLMLHTKTYNPLIVHAHLCKWPRLSPSTCRIELVPVPLGGERLDYYLQDWPECSGNHGCSSPGSQPMGAKNIDTVNHP